MSADKTAKAVLFFIHTNFTTEAERAEMKLIFQAFDNYLDGELSRNDVIAGLATMGVKNPEDRAD